MVLKKMSLIFVNIVSETVVFQYTNDGVMHEIHQEYVIFHLAKRRDDIFVEIQSLIN